METRLCSASSLLLVSPVHPVPKVWKPSRASGPPTTDGIVCLTEILSRGCPELDQASHVCCPQCNLSWYPRDQTTYVLKVHPTVMLFTWMSFQLGIQPLLQARNVVFTIKLYFQQWGVQQWGDQIEVEFVLEVLVELTFNFIVYRHVFRQ